jgi:hypothetical protein
MPGTVLPIASIQHSILNLRGQRVMLDEDLARLYGVPTKAFNQAVKRHAERFPADFRFQLTVEEVAVLRSQSVTSKQRGGRRYLPWGFTQEGVAMLSGVLDSPRAVAVNIEIMRAFVHMRRLLTANADLAKRLALVETVMGRHAAELGQHKAETARALKAVFDTLKALAGEAVGPEPVKQPLGFDLK